MSKQQRHERRKTERARRTRALARHPTSHIRQGAAALAAAAAIAAGTSAYAAPVRFDNPAGAGHFAWQPPLNGEVWLDLVRPADQQPEVPVASGVRQILQADFVEVGANPLTIAMQVGGPYGVFLLGVNGGDPIPSGYAWAGNGFAYFSGFGSQLTGQTYLGVRMDLGNGGYQYGWIGVEMDSIDHTLEAFAWGYETDPGTAIPAGVPEPGSLALLALGAAGLSTRRRRRQMAN